MKVRRAVVAGIVGCVIVLAAVAMAGWLSGSNADLCRLAGVLLTGRDDETGRLVGCAVQVVVAVIAALVYAAMFELVTRRAGTLIGLAIAIPHVVIAGLAVGFLPVTRLIGAGMTPPGAFLEYRDGWVVATFVLAHLAFGSVVGALYGATRHVVPTASVAWHDVTDGAD